MGTNGSRSTSDGILGDLDKQQQTSGAQGFKPTEPYSAGLNDTPWATTQGFGSKYNSMPKWLQEHMKSQEGKFKGLNYDISDIYNSYNPKISNLYNNYSAEYIAKPFWLKEGRAFKDSYLNDGITGQFDWRSDTQNNPNGLKALYNPWSGQQLTNAYQPGTAQQYAETKGHFPGTTASYMKRRPTEARPPNYLGGE